MDDKKIDESIAAKEGKIRSIDNKVAELTEQKKKLMESISNLKEKKVARFSRQLLDGLRKNGVPLNQETLQSLLAAAKPEEAPLEADEQKENTETAEENPGGAVNQTETPFQPAPGNSLFSSVHEVRS